MRILRLSALLSLATLTAWAGDRTTLNLTDTTMTLTSFTDKEVIVNGRSDLHLTANPQPLVNSVIKLNSDEAWLFIDNMRPAVVIDSVLKYVVIKDSAASYKINARVAVHKQGTVIIPLPDTIRPLTVYTGENCTGDSAKYYLFTRYTNLGLKINNKIRSFKLKRGYMATMATNTDGTGYSRVFVADDADLVFNTLPVELDQLISFIRVINWEYVSKKGWCGTGSGCITDAEKVNGTWSYSWSADQSSSDGVEYVPMRPKLTWPGWTEIYGKQYSTHLLGLNEPDHADQHEDDNGGNVVTVAQALAQWPDMLRSGLRLGSPACTDFSWLYAFMDSCKAKNYRVDYVAVHTYWGGKSAANWYNDLKYIHEKTGRPIWITEWNNGANWTTESWPTDSLARLQKQLTDITAILNVLDTAHFVERYSIYNWVEDKRAMLINGILTPAGSFYKANPSKIAFQRINEVIPTYTLTNPTLSISVGTKLATLVLTDSNGEFYRGFTLEKKTTDGVWETFFDSDSITLKYVADSIDLSINGSLRYRARSKWSGDKISDYTNEVGLDVSSGNAVQYGQAKIKNIGWNTVLFNQSYSVIPTIIIGGATNKNSTVLLTTRAKLINFSSSFNLQMIPWSYQKVTSLTAEETVPYLICAPGSYDFGGLKALASKATIAPTWTSVTFSTPFDTIPAVFTTQLLSSTSYATTVRVRNVSKTGFQARLMKETAITSTLTSESVSFFAIAPGTGIMDNHKVKVGITNPNVISLILSSINFGDSIANPLFLAQMQTCNDDTTAVLRTINVSNKYATVWKQREKSTGKTDMKAETGGWLVMDLDSEVVGLIKTSTESLRIYPNPATDRIYLGRTFPEGLDVSIYNIFGTLVSTVKVFGDQINVQDLPKGCYLMRSPDFGTAKFLKN
jgi:hypothetical protein